MAASPFQGEHAEPIVYEADVKADRTDYGYNVNGPSVDELEADIVGITHWYVYYLVWLKDLVSSRLLVVDKCHLKVNWGESWSEF